jgi:hypothetical protein
MNYDYSDRLQGTCGVGDFMNVSVRILWAYLRGMLDAGSREIMGCSAGEAHKTVEQGCDTFASVKESLSAPGEFTTGIWTSNKPNGRMSLDSHMDRGD